MRTSPGGRDNFVANHQLQRSDDVALLAIAYISNAIRADRLDHIRLI